MAPSKKESKLQLKSAAEFFSNNKTIAGFDNPGKSLYTTIREFVENSLDAAESGRVLPEISIRIEEFDQKTFNQMVGLLPMDRKNEKIYSERETGGEAVKNSRVKTMYYKVTVTDNGCGMPFADIPNMFGRVLAGTKYGVKQARGRFGLGAKMALIWSKMSTGKPIEISSSEEGSDYITHCILDIDIYENTPKVILHEKIENSLGWRGTELGVLIEGNWIGYRSRILQYMRQMAIITPYATFEFRFQSTGDPSKSFAVRYARRSEHMPDIASEVKHHPSSVNLIILKKLLNDAVLRKTTLVGYLTQEFSCIDKKMAHHIIEELGDEFDSKMPASSVTEAQCLQILHLFAQLKFPLPDGDCLSPAGEYNLRLGIMKELKPEMVATYQEPVRVYEGHPFIVDAGVSLGGKTVKPGLNVYRFANRIPLLFEAGGDVVTRTVLKKINWAMYKIRPNADKIGVFVSIVSTKIPFKGTGKEYIGDDAEEIARAVKHAIQQCCFQLKVKLVRAGNLKSQLDRKSNLVKYVPNVSKAIYEVLSKISKNGPREAEEGGSGEPSAKRLKLEEATGGSGGATIDWTYSEILRRVRSQEITALTLSKKLLLHVERTDAEQAFEYVASTGMKEGIKKEMFYIQPISCTREKIQVSHPECELYLIQNAQKL
eukprot:Sdes_comp19206_c0_seq1m10066